ncbi:MAG: ATP-binding protein [Saprospiraceae bacterium]|nr:ATP-binding protein [Saprospiraceae bacterium]
MHLAQKEITLVVGPRQAGKTTLLKALAAELRAKGEICLFFNLDIDRDAQFFSSQTRLVERVEALSEGRRAYVFIDEVQRIENAGLFLKGIYDRALPHKWIATGSGSIELKEKIGESLVGRKRNFYLYPVSPAEFVAYRTGKSVSQGAAVLATDPVESDRLLFEYLLYGGYPRVVTAPNASEKVAILDEIFQGYIERDIQLLLRVEKSRSFITLLQLLANRVGRLINWQDLANQTNLSVATVKQYFWYIEKTFIAAPATPYFTNKEKELVKTPQVYFWDTGLRNHLLNLRALDEQSPDFGFLFQQFVWLLLRHQFSDAVSSIHYWRTQHQAEVDFVVNRGADLLPVEVKSARLPAPRVERSLHSFIEAYAPAEAWVVNRTLSDEVWVGKTRVRFRQWAELVG